MRTLRRLPLRHRILDLSLVAVLASAATLAACGKAAGASEVVVTETVFNITLTPDTVPAGDIAFVVSNPSLMRHEFLVIRTDLDAKDLPLAPSGRVDEDAINIINTIEDVPPHGSGQLVLNLKPGHYVLICNLPEHYGHGMHVNLTVTDQNGNVPTASPSPSGGETPAASPSVGAGTNPAPSSSGDGT